MKTPIFLSTIVLTALLSLTYSDGYAQSDRTSEVKIYFRTGQSAILADYMHNRISLEELDTIFRREKIPEIESVSIDAYASPDGSLVPNERLSEQRAMTVRSYIADHYPSLPASKLRSRGLGIDWGLLEEMVEEDYSTPQRDRVLSILDTANENQTAAKNSLMALGGSWTYMLNKMFPLMRVVTVVSVTYKKEAPQPPAEVVVVPEPVEVPAEVVVEPVFEQVVETTVINEPLYGKKPLFALKTNLLYDIASALNVEIEVPIGKRWSIAGEYIFPWWLWKRSQIALETLSGHLDVRYWFGDRIKHDVMTGWFAGVYGGGGYYDVEWRKDGYQGEFYSVGLTGGFAHKIGRNLRLEYSLGVGYLDSKYREYKAYQSPDDAKWHLMRKRHGTSDWIGPTRVKIALVWMLNKKYLIK